MTVSQITATAGRPAARITLDGATTRRFRRELLGEYGLAADRIKECLHSLNEVDFKDLELYRGQLAQTEQVLNMIGWSREIADDEQVEIIGDAVVLTEIICTFLGLAALRLQEVAESASFSLATGGDLDKVDEAYWDVERWRNALTKLRATIGKDC